MMILRIWSKNTSSHATQPSKKRILWDFGDCQWELYDSQLKHFRVCSREKKGEEIHEIVEPLAEVPVPLGICSRQLVDPSWVVQESVLHLEQQPVQKNNVEVQQNTPQFSPSVKQSYPEKQQQAESTSPVEVSSQSSYILPAELWSSLSQWIPPHALFQPSLHHLASLELSDTPIQPSQNPSYQASYSQSGPTQRQPRGQYQRSKPYPPKPSSHMFQADRPLFVL